MLRANNRPLLAYFDAIKNLRLRQVTLILKTGYDPNLMVNARGQNGLQFMINYFGATDAHFRLQAPINRATYLSIAKLLLDSGLDPNNVDLLSGETVMFDVIRLNDKEMVSLLLNYIDFSLRNKNGETVVMCAARFGSKQVMRMILEHLRHLEMDGYFLRQRNRLGLTALELARVENLDCAKVITKHLVAFGHHPANSMLTRSSSNHQLLARNYPAAYPTALHAASGAGVLNVAHCAPSAAVLDDSDLSDYEMAEMLAVSGQAAFVAGRSGSIGAGAVMNRGVGVAPAYKQPVAAYYDPKVAEFNQYLLEQRQQQKESQQQQQQYGGGQIVTSDDEDYFGMGPGGSTSGLVRSRSCILGPSGSKQPQQRQKAYAQASTSKRSSGGATEDVSGTRDQAGNKMASSSWESGNRSTIA